MEQFIAKLRENLQGEIVTDEAVLKELSHDASLFEVKPQVVVYPKNDSDVEKLVEIVNEFKDKVEDLSLTARSAGTDMSGGPLNESVIVDFTKYFNQTPKISDKTAITQPGVYYRDFEIETLKHGLIFPSYPASKTICAMGGIVNNNSGGEKSLRYGKTEKYVKKVRAVLADGETYMFRPISKSELDKKIKQKDFEGEIYKEINNLIEKNKSLIQRSRPTVAKNSAGYNLWDVWDEEKKIFDMTKLWTGAQGTLGLMLSAEIGLVPVRKHREMVIIFLKDLSNLGDIINKILPFEPESFESYDDNTLKLALRYFPEFAKQLGIWGMIQAGLAFLPAFMMMFTGRLPKLILQVDFTGDTTEEIKEKVDKLLEELKPLKLRTEVAAESEENKYWLVRRESFNLLRKKIREKHTAPFIDDFVIDPQKIQSVLPQVTGILEKHPEFIFTVAGHVGEGNFHIIPLVDIKDPKVRKAIPEIAEEVYRIVTENNGSITGEHNDGIIRTPFLSMMYGKEMVQLFEEVKKIFDPKGIFNPGKKVGGSIDYAMDHLRENWE